MRIRLFRMAIVALLLALVVPPNSIAQKPRARKGTLRTAVFRGATSLNAPRSSLQTQAAQTAIDSADREIDPQAAIKRGAGVATGTAAAARTASAPSIPTVNGGTLLTFDGTDAVQSRSVNPFNVEPPDQGLCVGNGFTVEVNNIAIEIFDNTGNLIQGPLSEYDFFLLPQNHFPIGDGRCYYDIPSGRFFITMLDLTPEPRFFIHIAVSNDSDVFHGWLLYSIDATNDGSDGTPLHFNCPCLGDQPLLGANLDAIFISTNEFGLVSGFNGAQIYAISKEPLEETVLPTVVQFENIVNNDGNPAFSIQPAISPDLMALEGDTWEGAEFLMSSTDIFGTGATNIGVWAIINTNNLDDAVPVDVTLQEVVVNTEFYDVPPDAIQKAGPIPLGTARHMPEKQIQTDDDRMQQAVFAYGKLKGALTTGFNNDSVSAIAWFVVKPTIDSSGTLTAKRVKQGYVVGPPGQFLFYPAIAVNGDGVGIIAFGLSGPNFFPSSAFIHFSAVRGTYGKIHIAALGKAPEDGFTCYGSKNAHCRWGDYSAAVVDDLDPTEIWFATNYISGVERNASANWATSISVVGVP
jgi:hypothetical protein